MSYAPDVPPLLLFAEKTWLVGTLVAGVAYGVVLTLFSICVPHLAAKPKCNYPHAKRRWWLLLYISACFILGTLNIASEAKMAELAFVDNRNYPGGPAMYETAMYAIPVSSMGSVGFVLTNWGTDCLLIWRCLVIYRGCMDQLSLVMIGPVLLLLTSLVTGTLWLLQVTKSSPWSSNMGYTLAYAIATLSINFIVPSMIVIRLAIHRRNVVKALGVQHGEHYASIISMLIESASLVSLFVIFLLVPFVMNSPIAIIAIQTAPQIQIIASLLIIFRVARDKDWSPVAGMVTQDVEAAMSRVGEMNLVGQSNTGLHEDTVLPMESTGDHRLSRLVHESP